MLWITGFFLIAYFFPVNSTQFRDAVISAVGLVNWYAREHVLTCLIPAFFIAGVISVFVNQQAVIKYFGAQAKKWLSYLVASVSGSILAVCSCTILPMFAGIYKRGAGLGPAVTFLYAGPAINILAMILTTRVLGYSLGLARIIGAIIMAILIGLLMHLIFIREENSNSNEQQPVPVDENARPVWQTVSLLSVLVGILLFATGGCCGTGPAIWIGLFKLKWIGSGFLSLILAYMLYKFLNVNKYHIITGVSVVIISIIFLSEYPVLVFTIGTIILSVLLSTSSDEAGEWMQASWGFVKQIVPLLAAGVLVAGFLMGTPGVGNGLIPEKWISGLVGGNSFGANLFASVAGAFMYFATLTEVPILRGLMDGGMGKGPALALLLAGPAVSLPNMLVINSVIGFKKTITLMSLIVLISSLTGFVYGNLF